jgi:hypothetical protein
MRTKPRPPGDLMQNERMRRRITIVLAAALALAGLASAVPAQAEAPVAVKKDSCGNTNVYVMGRPVFHYNNVWCPPPPEDI